MNANQNSEANTPNVPKEVITFQFSESNDQIRNVFINGEVKFIASDVAKALGYKNSRKALKDHCRYVTNSYIPHPQSKSKTLNVSVIPESDVYRLIIKSTLPKAQEFERWVMEDVLPNLRKKGYYALHHPKQNFIDARDIPHFKKEVNGFFVRCITINNEVWISVNDVNRSIGSSTDSKQTANKLNAKQTLAKKIWLFGNTQPSWFTNQLGVNLLLAGSRKLRQSNQLNLSL